MTKTILLADDSLTIQKVVELTFADTQYHVVAVSSGDELLDKLHEIQPEVVICDIIMPGRDGYDVCQEIKSNPDSLHIPVILLSGTFEPFDRDRALAVGCSEIITKPFEAKRLVDAVEKLLSPSAAAEETDPGPGPSPGLEPAGPTSDVDFGTRLSNQADEPEAPSPEDAPPTEPGDEPPQDGIDFTTSGFAEMEAAAEATSTPSTELPAAGIDFDITAGPGPVTEPTDGPSFQPATNRELSGADDEEFADAFSSDLPAIEETADAPGVGAADADPDPFGSSEESVPAGGPEHANDGPFAAAFAPDTAPGGDEEAPLADFGLKTAEEAFSDEPAPVVLTDADTAPVPPLDEEPVDDEPVAEFPTPPGSVEGEEESQEEAPTPIPLSDEDVDRIARRVIELASERIEQVAWEVIPDVAEVAVRERIRQLESEFETEN